MKTIRLVLILAVLLVLSWVGSIGYANYQFVQALRAQDGPTVASYVDFPQLRAHFMERSTSKSKEFMDRLPIPNSGRETMLSGMISANKTLIETTVTEGNVLNIFSGLNKWKELREQAASLFSPAASSPNGKPVSSAGLAVAYDGWSAAVPNAFIVRLKVSDTPVAVHWSRSGLLNWKIVDVQ